MFPDRSQNQGQSGDISKKDMTPLTQSDLRKGSSLVVMVICQILLGGIYWYVIDIHSVVVVHTCNIVNLAHAGARF